jgi:hypothetical protein
VYATFIYIPGTGQEQSVEGLHVASEKSCSWVLSLEKELRAPSDYSLSDYTNCPCKGKFLGIVIQTSETILLEEKTSVIVTWIVN